MNGPPSKFLELQDEETFYIWNCVTLDQHGHVDPNTHVSEFDAHNGATYRQIQDKFELGFDLDCHMISCEEDGRNGQDTYVCQIARGTPIPDALRLWMTVGWNPYYVLRARVSLSLPELQRLLSEFHAKHGKVTSFDDYLASDLGLSEEKLPVLQWQQKQMNRKIRPTGAGEKSQLHDSSEQVEDEDEGEEEDEDPEREGNFHIEPLLSQTY